MGLEYNSISRLITIFQQRVAPEEGYLVGYGAIMNAFGLPTLFPDVLSIVSHKHRKYETEEWRVFTPRHIPEDTLMGHLTFALKYEGIELGIFKKLFEVIPQEELAKRIQLEPTGQYNRRIWFLYEWLMDAQLNIPDLATEKLSQ
jgi:hypothetical protein